MSIFGKKSAPKQPSMPKPTPAPPPEKRSQGAIYGGEGGKGSGGMLGGTDSQRDTFLYG